MLIDDVVGNTENDESHNIWYMEGLQERIRFNKFFEWNAKTKMFTTGDVLGFGDTDEVAARKNVHMLKYCDIAGAVDIGIWFASNDIDSCFSAIH